MSHERLSVSGAELDDLDLSALDAFVTARAPTLRATMQLEEVALRLGLLVRAAPRVAPTPVGLLLFGKTPQLVAPDWGVAAVCIDGTTLSDPVRYRLDLEGNLASLLAQGLAFGAAVGFSRFPGDGDDAASLLRAADNSMYRDKR